MRAKLKIASVTQYEGSEELKLNAVCGKFGEDGQSEDNTYAKWTPTAALTMMITNPALRGAFKAGDEFYLDFTPVAKPEASASS